jgi:metal-responsive CopG/Arc/MetJ family transcriptional regulator
MKSKISITLSEPALRDIAQHSADFKSRSEFIEAAVASFVARRQRQRTDRRDLEILDQMADRLNAEAEDVLGYQVPL